ncbi:hypothetical protein D3C78_1897690 [compost metagenome]
MHSSGYAGQPEPFLYRVALVDLYRVLRPGAEIMSLDPGGGDVGQAQQSSVFLGGLLSQN